MLHKATVRNVNRALKEVNCFQWECSVKIKSRHSGNFKSRHQGEIRDDIHRVYLYPYKSLSFSPGLNRL